MNVNIRSVTPTKALPIMRACYELGQALMLHGPRGVGKTAIVDTFNEQVVHGTVWKILLTQMEAVDLRGLTYPDEKDNVTRVLTPDFFPQKGPGIIFLDELTAAETRLMKPAYQLLLERRLGERYQVPPDVWVCAAGNTGDDGAVVHQIDAPAADRMVHVRVIPSADDWIRDWAIPHRLSPEIIAFIKSRPDKLDQVKIQVQMDTLLAPSPRGWNRLDAFLKAKLPRDVIEVIAAGILGDGVAAEFLAIYDEILGQSTVQQILAAKPAERWRLLPMTMIGLLNISYSAAALVVDVKSALQAMTIVNLFHEVETDLPMTEIETLCADLVFSAIATLKLQARIISTPEYKAYWARHQKRGLP